MEKKLLMYDFMPRITKKKNYPLLFKENRLADKKMRKIKARIDSYTLKTIFCVKEM